MRKPINRPSSVALALSMLAILGLSGCGAPAASAPDATQTVSAIYTAAAGTFTAQLASTPATAAPTQTALPSPTATTGASGPGLPITGGTAAPGGTTGTAGPQCNNSVYVNDATIPDGTVMRPSTAFTKTWTVMNTGTCSWTSAYKLVFITGEPMGGTSVPVPAPVPAGKQVRISVNLTSPVIPGNYTGTWQLEDAQGNRFGEMITVVIVVSNTGGTSITATP